MTASLMVAPKTVGGGVTMFVAGDDPEAKAVVVGLLRDFGWDDVLDLGDLTGARAMEMHLPLWLRLSGTLGTSSFGVKVVR